MSKTHVCIGPLIQKKSGKQKNMEVHHLGQDAKSLIFLHAKRSSFQLLDKTRVPGVSQVANF